ncbi:MAG: hypothetical protein P8101_21255, partial [Candidatus Thiodiazotropha sp.]
LKLLLATYFGSLGDNLQLTCELPVAGVHVDLSRSREELNPLLDWLPAHKILSLGILDGRNVWKCDLNAQLDWLEPVHERLRERLWLAPSCSLLHLPVDLEQETQLDTEIRSWLSFAEQKLTELEVLGKALNQGREAVMTELKDNAKAIESSRHTSLIHNPRVQSRLRSITPSMESRHTPYAERQKRQRERFGLPLLPTTTIGSFPQTGEIRQLRRKLREGNLSATDYETALRQEIVYCIQQQEEITLGWTGYAQSLTDKPVKGMLTGPVTMLNWSFVRDDQPLATTATQLAMDADVITIENARSDDTLLDIFEDFDYSNGIGPGVYDIHSPNIPSVTEIQNRIRATMEKIPLDRLWINPDCGLKTRQWQEVVPALKHLQQAARMMREEVTAQTR